MKQMSVIGIIVALIIGLLIGSGFTMVFLPPQEIEVEPELPAERLCPTVDFLIISEGEAPIRYAAADIIVDAWEELGIPVNRIVAEMSTVWGTCVEGPPWDDWNAMTMGHISRPERFDPNTLLGYFVSDRIEGMNYAAFNSSTYDMVIDMMATEMDAERRRELSWIAQEIFVDEHIIIPMYCGDMIQFYNKDKFGGNVYQREAGGGIHNWWTYTEMEPLTEDTIIDLGTAERVNPLNPVSPELGHEVEILRFVYDTLCRINPDGIVEPILATNVEVVSPTTIDMTIQENAKWHDGEPLTADDVKFTFDYIKEWEFTVHGAVVEPIESVEVLNQTAVRFNLYKPNAAIFITAFCYVPILPEHIWDGLVEREDLEHPEEWNNPNPVGSGPYKVDAFLPDEEVRLVKNEDYWKVPKADGLRWILYADDVAFVNGLKTGEADSSEVHTLIATIVEELLLEDHLEMVQTPSIGIYFTGINHRIPPFDNKAFREAICYTIPYQHIVDDLLLGRGTIEPSIIGSANEYWHNPSIPDYEYDLEMATQILKSNGYDWDAEGRLYLPPG